ncbi:MAG: hypothetical protein WCG80_05460 [Spirochaetales bacterium]
MRTTLSIDDDIFAAAKSMALLKNIALGTALSELARAGLNQRTSYPEGDLPTFSVSEKAPVFGLREVQAAEDDL